MEDTMQPAALAPWGIGRMRPFPRSEILPAAHLSLDAETQLPVWTDASGVPVPALERHKRSETSKETTTRTSLDGEPDEGSDQQGDSD
ncbi:putative ATP-grasp-modified RiPP [Streptomyces sp. JW3]|uniref:putative ATP-grasp-modified RiPP n=1 Tax=Streptomyces sp. JW3 TaxID=3456955 RepID=UPI003FA433AF